MSINLTKGESINLSKTHGLNAARIGLGWELSKVPLDLDACVFLLSNASGKPVCPDASNFIFFGNLSGVGVKHHGDYRTGAGDGDDEVIDINFEEIEAKLPMIDEISVIVTIYQARQKGQSFGSLKNAEINIYNPTTNTKIANYDLDENFPDKYSVQVGSFKKVGPKQWEFEAVGIGFAKELGEICQVYGLPV